MIWYNINKVGEDYIVFKNVQIKHSIGSIGKFRGTKKQCEKYCENNNIKLGEKNKKVVS